VRVSYFVGLTCSAHIRNGSAFVSGFVVSGSAASSYCRESWTRGDCVEKHIS
jgi:hypothetical protein